MVDDRDKAFRTMDRPAAHAPDPDQRRAIDRATEGVGAALIVLGPPPLDNGHEARLDSPIARSDAALDRRPARTCHPAEYFVSVCGDHVFGAIDEDDPHRESTVGREMT